MCTSLHILQAVFFTLPFVLTGLVHVAVIKNNLFPILQTLPLDAGLRFRGRRLFGENKTLRGLVTVTGVLIIWIYAETALLTHLSLTTLNPFEHSNTSTILTGMLLGIGWIVGELPNSFIKRQFDIPPGFFALGYKGLAFWFADQIDSVLGVLVMAALVLRLHPCHLVFIFVLGLVLHPLADVVMAMWGLKSRQFSG